MGLLFSHCFLVLDTYSRLTLPLPLACARGWQECTRRDTLAAGGVEGSARAAGELDAGGPADGDGNGDGDGSGRAGGVYDEHEHEHVGSSQSSSQQSDKSAGVEMLRFTQEALTQAGQREGEGEGAGEGAEAHVGMVLQAAGSREEAGMEMEMDWARSIWQDGPSTSDSACFRTAPASLPLVDE